MAARAHNAPTRLTGVDRRACALSVSRAVRVSGPVPCRPCLSVSCPGLCILCAVPFCPCPCPCRAVRVRPFRVGGLCPGLCPRCEITPLGEGVVLSREKLTCAKPEAVLAGAS